MSDEGFASFLRLLRDIDWLSHTGEPHGNARVVASIGAGFDDDGSRMLEAWLPHTKATEESARRGLGDAVIDRVFIAISAAIQDSLYRGLCAHLERTYRHRSDDEAQLQRTVDEALYPEIMDAIKRDVCWAGVEWMLERPGFFTALFELYRCGRWPCAWDGAYPEGRAVIL